MPEPGHLTRWQKAQIAAQLRGADFDHRDFHWLDEPGYGAGAARLTLKGSPYYFEFAWDGLNRDHVLVFSPDSQTISGFAVADDWDDAVRVFSAWLKYLRRELDTVDPWSLDVEEQKLVEAASTSRAADDHFTEDEQRLLAASLEEVERAIREVRKLTVDQQAFLSKEVHELKERMNRMRRWDWTKFMLGTILGVLGWLQISPSEIHGALSHVYGILQGIFAGNPPQLP